MKINCLFIPQKLDLFSHRCNISNLISNISININISKSVRSEIVSEFLEKKNLFFHNFLLKFY